MEVAIFFTGIFTLILGIVHLFLPLFLGYKETIVNSKIKSKHLFRNLHIKSKDLIGIVWVMNNHASFVLITIGLVEVFCPEWILSDGRILCLWIGFWWVFRAINQLFLGLRIGDVLLMVFFCVLAIIHFGGIYL